MFAGFRRHRQSVFTMGAAEVVMIEVPEDRTLRVGMGRLGDEATSSAVKFQGYIDFGAMGGIEAADKASFNLRAAI